MYEHGEEKTSDEDIKEGFIIGSDPAQHVERIRGLEQLGATIIVLQNNSGADPTGDPGLRRVGLPALRGARVA